MSRKVLDVMNDIFDVLETFVSDEDKYRIIHIVRHIKAQGDEHPVCDFVKRAKMKTTACSAIKLTLFEYSDQRYLMIPDKYVPTLNKIGFEFETNTAIIQGAEMLAIANKQLCLQDSVSSLLIIEQCLGVDADTPEETSVTIDFPTISELFEPQCMVKLDDSRFPLNVEEDINRLVSYLIIDQVENLSPSSRYRLKELVLLLSSRTISASILNGIQSPLIEYTFLQFYQCIEYLFKLNNCFIISESHNLSLEKSMDIVLAHELRITESENLYSVLKNNASESSIDAVISIMNESLEENSDKYRKASNYLYKLRCNIAHLRYDQDDISDVSWVLSIDALIDVILSVYKKRDSDIIRVCTNKNSWTDITIKDRNRTQ